jgi:hypothetical protein
MTNWEGRWSEDWADGIAETSFLDEGRLLALRSRWFYRCGADSIRGRLGLVSRIDRKLRMTRLARALTSDDLSHRETDCDPDHLQAAGLTSIHRSLGVLIIEAKEGAAGEGAHSVARVKDLQACLSGTHERPGLIQRMAQRWRVRVNVEGVAIKVAQELILDRCSVCQGRGFIPMRYDGTRLIAVVEDDGPTKDVDCAMCLGSGAARRDYHGRAKAAGFHEYTKRLSEWWEAVLASCCDAEIGARASMRRRLK